MRIIVRNVRKCWTSWNISTPKLIISISRSSRSAILVTLASTAWISYRPWYTSDVVSRPSTAVTSWPSRRCSIGYKRIVSSSPNWICLCMRLAASHPPSSFTQSSSSSASKDPIKKLPKIIINSKFLYKPNFTKFNRLRVCLYYTINQMWTLYIFWSSPLYVFFFVNLLHLCSMVSSHQV